MKLVGKPDALIGHVRFDERGWETEHGQSASSKPRPSSTLLYPVQQWLREDYPALAERAKAEKAEIQWTDETGFRRGNAHGFQSFSSALR